MKKLYLFLLIFAVFIFQFSVLGVFLRESRVPNLFVSLTIGMALLFGFSRSVSWIIYSGLLMDLMTSWNIGSGTLVLVLILWFVERIKVVTEFRSKRYFFVFLFAVLVFLTSFLFDFLLKLELQAERYVVEVSDKALLIIADFEYFLKLVYSSVFGVIIYFFLRKTVKNSSLPLVSRSR